MTKECFVCISGHADAPDIEAVARYHKKDSAHYLFFEREAGGLSEKFSLRFDKDYLSYKRDGEVKTEVFLKTGQTRVSKYVTPYGTFDIGFETVEFLLEETDSAISIRASYNTTLNGEPHEEGKIKIEITEVKV